MASRMIYDTRNSVFGALHLFPDHVMFTTNSTETLNIAIHGLFSSRIAFITTDLEHNSVLRPLYRLRRMPVRRLGFPTAVRLIQYEDLKV